MFSLQKLFGKDDRFFDLLEASAEESRRSVQALIRALAAPQQAPGMTVSTTHAITTSIMGVGCAKRFSALKLKVVERIIWAWILTIPATAGVAFGLVWLCNRVGWIK